MSTYAIGDVHGWLDKLTRLLADSGLIDEEQRWSGGDARLVLVGDYMDRGPNGVGVLDLLMRLQAEAPASGGEVICLLGNHDVLLLGACHFGGTFDILRHINGGKRSDVEAVTAEQIEWLSDLPAMRLIDDTLFTHNDSMFYSDYGLSVDVVNERIRAVLHGREQVEWAQLEYLFASRYAFANEPQLAEDFLTVYGGKRLVHGHTPIPKMTGQDAEEVTRPLVYADGLCVDIDGQMYAGGPGFVYRVP